MSSSQVPATNGVHHVAYACRDLEVTRHFYEDLFGFPLVHTEVQRFPGGWFRHVFFDAGDGASLAFFELCNAGEQPGWTSNLSERVGLPVWVNHVAFRATIAKQESVRAAMEAADIKPLMDVDHGWCHSLYYLDPNGIMVELCRDTPGFTPNAAEAHALLETEPLPGV